jgi:hypothetical protein
MYSSSLSGHCSITIALRVKYCHDYKKLNVFFGFENQILWLQFSTGSKQSSGETNFEGINQTLV